MRLAGALAGNHASPDRVGGRAAAAEKSAIRGRGCPAKHAAADTAGRLHGFGQLRLEEGESIPAAERGLKLHSGPRHHPDTAPVAVRRLENLIQHPSPFLLSL